MEFPGASQACFKRSGEGSVVQGFASGARKIGILGVSGEFMRIQECSRESYVRYREIHELSGMLNGVPGAFLELQGGSGAFQETKKISEVFQRVLGAFHCSSRAIHDSHECSRNVREGFIGS